MNVKQLARYTPSAFLVESGLVFALAGHTIAPVLMFGIMALALAVMANSVLHWIMRGFYMVASAAVVALAAHAFAIGAVGFALGNVLLGLMFIGIAVARPATVNEGQ